jgi:hypothetical protein
MTGAGPGAGGLLRSICAKATKPTRNARKIVNTDFFILFKFFRIE